MTIFTNRWHLCVLFLFSFFQLIQNNIYGLDRQTSQQNQFAWHSTGDMHLGVGSGVIDTRNHSKDVAEDVEVMSTDSSSSSSSDSQ